MTALTRRRFLTISASAAALAAYAGPASAARWRGIALGAPASLQLRGVTAAQAGPVFALIEGELARLEAIFSLYRADSQLGCLNRDGQLRAPAPELLNLLSLCSAIHDATGGMFDPSVQPAWAALARAAPAAELAEARALTGWRRVHFDAAAVRFGRPGMALTLNGIAQGAVTGRIAAVLRGEGYREVLVDMGEIAAAGGGWRAGIAAPDGQILRRITLRDRALATSAALGSRIGAATQTGHILHPEGKPPVHQLASVSAPDAAVADGLSTALCLMDAAAAAAAVSRFPGARLELLA